MFNQRVIGFNRIMYRGEEVARDHNTKEQILVVRRNGKLDMRYKCNREYLHILTHISDNIKMPDRCRIFTV